MAYRARRIQVGTRRVAAPRSRMRLGAGTASPHATTPESGTGKPTKACAACSNTLTTSPDDAAAAATAAVVVAEAAAAVAVPADPWPAEPWIEHMIQHCGRRPTRPALRTTPVGNPTTTPTCGKQPACRTDSSTCSESPIAETSLSEVGDTLSTSKTLTLGGDASCCAAASSWKACALAQTFRFRADPDQAHSCDRARSG